MLKNIARAKEKARRNHGCIRQVSQLIITLLIDQWHVFKHDA